MDETPLYMEAAFAAFGRELMDAATGCARCEGDDFAPPECAGCVAEVARNRQDARDELVRWNAPTPDVPWQPNYEVTAVYYGGHGLGHTYRPDVTR